MTMERKSVHTTTLKNRPSAFAHEAREKARSAVGSERDALLNKASRAETAASIDDWAGSQKAEMMRPWDVAAFYRIYVLTLEGRVAAPPHVVECADDREAIRIARDQLSDKTIEVWDKARRVIRIEP